MYKLISRLALTSAVGVTLAACETAEDYQPPAMALPASFTEGDGASVGQTADQQWWLAFRDRRLNDIVSRGLAQNIDIRIARERVNAAAAAARGAGVPFDGNLGLAAGGRGASDAPEELFATGTLGVSWTADAFGRQTSERRLAAANLGAAQYGVESARLALLGEVTAAYIDARFFQESLALTRATLNSRRETLSLTERLLEASAATSLDAAQARGLVDETLAQVPVLESGFRRSAHRVSTLLGQPAGAMVPFLTAGAPQPYPSQTYRTGVPADLLRNRPDIQAAERQLAAAAARTGIARADLYPSFNLTGLITGTVADTGNVATWSFGPIVNLPLFGRERLTSAVSQREAEARIAFLAWQNTVLRAVEEVENAIVALRRDRQAIAAERRSVDTLAEAARLARDSYSRGEASVLSVLDAERNVSRARNSLAAANRRHALNFVAFNVAIGAGRGFGAQPATTAVAAASGGN